VKVVTKAEQTYERVEALVAQGSSKADAFKRIAEETERPVNSIRGAYYQHTKKLGGGGKPRRRETTPQDAVESAKRTLEQAIESIDAEIEAAKERADEAKSEYEALRKSANERKQAIATKIEALAA
jgi:hypothetical protein